MADVWPALAEDGLLIYSTCTYNPAENEDIISWLDQFTSTEAVSLNIPDDWGIVTTQSGDYPCYRFYPHRVRGEGFFTAAVRKKSREESRITSKLKTALPLASKNEQLLLNKLIKDQSISLLKFEESFLAWPTSLLNELDQIKTNLRIVHAGVKVGEIKQGIVIPAHELAISTIADNTFFPQIELSLAHAITYLKKDNFLISIPEMGWNLVTYENIPLGWLKNIRTRFNNSYPKEWRIHMKTTEFTGDRLLDEAKKFPL